VIESRALLVIACTALGGCASWTALDGQRERQDAEADHAACVARDLAFPGDAYTLCRRQLADARQMEQWLELSMAQLQRRQQAPEFLVVPLPAPYRAIDPRHFRCEQRGVAPATWIACREQ
jgi:hypothetical protein